jgi:hypothetical protein
MPKADDVKFLLPLFLCFAATVAFALPSDEFITAHSYSGQFTAQEIRGRAPFWAPSPLAARVPIAGSLAFLLVAPPTSPMAPTDKIPLEPALLVVSCERIKNLFLLELGMRDEWQSQIDLVIDSSLPDEQEPLLTAIHSPDGWRYQLELPKTMRPGKLMRAVIQTLLTEMANRHAAGQSAEIPYWLVEGMSAHLQAYNLPTFIIRPNVQSAGYTRTGIEGLNAIRAGLRGHAPLTFQQLSWPQPMDATGPDQALYDSCAELFFESLLHLDDGPSCFQQLLQEMPRHLNWQTAFLRAFHSHFAGLLDVEKWWGLNCVSFSETDLTRPRTEEECWHKLQDALDVPVDVHFSASRMPAPACVTLQEVIEQWKDSDALPALQRAVRELEGLQWFTFRCDLNLDESVSSPGAQRNAQQWDALQRRMSQELGPLVNRYLTVLASYVRQLEAASQGEPDKRTPASRLYPLKHEVARQLNNLDRERDAMRSRIPAVSQTAEVKQTETPRQNSGPAPISMFHLGAPTQ